MAVAAAAVTADQLTKTWALHLPPTIIAGNAVNGRHVIGPIFFELTFNYGTAFGIVPGVGPVVEVALAVVVLALALWGWRVFKRASTPATIGLGLLVGGAVSNLADRVFRHDNGAVIDFIDALQIGNHQLWPPFNVADSCIVVGGVILVGAYYRSGRRSAHHAARPAMRDDDSRPDPDP